MEAHRFETRVGGSVELDICFACQGLWFDPRENTQLAPDSVVALFQLLHEHRDDAHHPVGSRLQCPRCRLALSHGFDVVRSGRYVTYRQVDRRLEKVRMTDGVHVTAKGGELVSRVVLPRLGAETRTEAH